MVLCSSEVRENKDYLYLKLVAFLILEKGKLKLSTKVKNIKKLLGKIKNFDIKLWKHSIFVMKFSLNIAQYINLDKYALENLLVGSLLHDIGKTHISREILNKKGPLNEREWEIVKQHPLLGREILKNYSNLQDIIPLVLFHHERWDGKGYYGLKGKEIPFNARIIVLADSIEAMTSYRTYQKARDANYVLRELERCKGKHFDPQIVNILLQNENIDNFLKKCRKVNVI